MKISGEICTCCKELTEYKLENSFINNLSRVRFHNLTELDPEVATMSIFLPNKLRYELAEKHTVLTQEEFDTLTSGLTEKKLIHKYGLMITQEELDILHKNLSIKDI